MRWRLAAGCACVALAGAGTGAAEAGEVVLYQPAPDWITPAPAIDVAAGADPMPLFDSQRRFEKGRVWSYADIATRVVSEEMLAQAGTVSIPWSPDQGDLIVHRVEILRGPERIDLVKGGQRFAVLRREEGLERRMMTGLLTATLPVQGLRVGDVLRVGFSITAADPALGGRTQALMGVLAAPVRAGFARAKLRWPEGETINWKVHGTGAAPGVAAAGGWREVTLAMPLAKQPEMPDDAPARFRRAPMLEATSFADWADVSRTFAPLYATAGLIEPGGELDREVKRIAAATPDPLARTQAALELVQDKVRYLLMGMAGGNYLPQKPAQTWAMRYGDCKAKTLMLLAILRALDVEAEAVLATSAGGDALPDRLPMPGAFDHVLVRATVAGESLWLDGTGAGSRLADIRDTPAFRHVLPLRAAGAPLMPVPMRAPARPEIEAALDLDESAAVDLPALFTAKIVVRGATAARLAAGAAQAGPEQKREMAKRIVGGFLSDPTLSDHKLDYDRVAGAATITASGLASTGWSREDKRYRRGLDRAVTPIDFQPNRARPAWAAIPVATADPSSALVRTRVKLPEGGRGFALEGERDFVATLGGQSIRRTAALADGVVTVEERVDSSGVEIAPADVPAERARLALAKARVPKLVAPADVPRYWQVAGRAGDEARLQAIEAAFARAIAADPDDASTLQWRARYRSGVGDRRGALADFGRAIAIEGSVERYLERAQLRREMNDDKAALADVEEALKLDPASAEAVIAAAEIRGDMGEGAAALAMLDEKIALGGKQRFDYLRAKADIQSELGDVAGAIATADAAVADGPGDPDLLNARCWIKGTRSTALDTALKDCTKAIELSENPAAALDSRAMVYFRLNRAEDALEDLEAALDAAPEQASSFYLRGVIRKGQGQGAPADADLAAARALSPRIDQEFARYGIKP